MKDQTLSSVLPTDECASAALNSPLDRPLAITKFNDAGAVCKFENRKSLRELAPIILRRTAATKDALPWLKVASFGDVPTMRGSLRHNANVASVDGVEGDHDAGTLTIEEAGERLRRAGLAALIYTTPSHTPEKPRWRVLCPASRPLLPEERERLCARLNGVMGGALAAESFSLSQAYYYGSVGRNPAHRVDLLDGQAIDLATGLDASALGRDGTPYLLVRATIEAEHAPGDLDKDDLGVEPPWQRIRAALDSIPVSARDDRETHWRPVGMALHSETAGSEEGFDRWDEWSQASAKYNADDQRRVWESFGRTGGSVARIGTLYHLAKQHGWSGRRESVASELGRLTFLSPDQCAAAPSRGYVVKGIVAPGDVGCIFGAPGAGKSLIAPHIGYMVARGCLAFGMRTRAGGVLYVAAEDPHGMRGRVTALKLAHGDAPSFTLVEGVSDLLASHSPDLAALNAAVAARRPALIFLDTLAMSFPGLEENTADGMGRVVAVARSLTKHGAAVVLIHHDTKAEGSTPRGHSVLNGALDMALQLFPRDDAGIIRGRMTKNRNGPCDRDLAFRIDTRDLGQDEDGDAITVALVDELAPGVAPRREKLNPAETAALDVLTELLRAGDPLPDGRTGVREERWRRECDESRRVSSSDNAGSRRKAMQRALGGLARKHRVQMRDGWVSAVDPAHDADFDPFADLTSEAPL